MHPITISAKRTLTLFALTLFLSAFLVQQVSGQNSCKPKTRANRHKTFTYTGKDRIEESFTDQEYTIRIKKAAIDTVSVYKDNQLYTTFLVRYRNITSASIDYVRDGTIYTDSIRSGMTRKVVYDYYGYFQSGNVWATYNHKDRGSVYYDRFGRDSLYISRYPNGHTQQMTWVNKRYAYARKQWAENGKLVYEQHGPNETFYDPPGQLKNSHYDTLIKGRTLTCRKTWMSNGEPDSVSYYYEGKPCHTWSFYDAKSRQYKTIRKKPVEQFPLDPPQERLVHAYEAPEIFRSVSQSEEYPGMEQYLNAALAHVLCKSPEPLNGTYIVRTQLSETGKLSFISASGANADAIQQALKQMIEDMPHWKPAKEYPKTIALVLDFRFKITPTDVSQKKNQN